MFIRDAQVNDAEEILRLLRQVLELHAAIRPDIFISGTTKYTKDEVAAIVRDPQRRSFVAVDESGKLLGYALCILKAPAPSVNTVPFSSLYIDDLCVDAEARGQHVGKRLFAHVRQAAKEMGCYEITLNVWEGNDGARAFYDKMGMTPKSTQMELIL